MVTEHVDADTGTVFMSSSTSDHGWSSPDVAVKHWKSNGRFEAHKNGRITRNPDTGVDVRAFFEVPEPETLFELTGSPPESSGSV